MVEILGPLPARPPTPPKASTRTLSHDEKSRSEASPAEFQTPGDSPLPGNGTSGAPSTRTSKKVNFSLSPKYIKPPTFTNPGPKPKSDLKTLIPSNECRPAKSILKATQSPVFASLPSRPPNTPESFAMFLESVTQQLAGESISCRLDAYMQFFGALMAYEGVPGEREMSGKLGLISQFIQRDLSRNPESNGPLDTNLVTQALKLSAALVWYHEISAQLPDDFKIFLVDHSIGCVQDDKLPKSILMHWMSILATQNFTAKIMTNARITRLLTVLRDITERVNGNSIISQRLGIYHRVLGQSKSSFVSHSALWMEHLVQGLLSHKKDIRLKAISLGFQTSMAIGPNLTLSKNLRDVLDRQLDEGRKLVSEVCGRLLRMMTLPDNGAHVPQAWSIIILLLRSKSWTIDQWEYFRDWVLIIQKCFNRSEPAVKTQAILGWNRFVFAISPNETTSPSVLKMLRRPIESQFGRKKQDECVPPPSQLALSSYYSLLYYAFRPSASHYDLDAVWEEYVYIPASETFTSAPILCDRFSEALCNLLWSSQGRVWAENKPIETNKLDPQELPSIDCKWIRSRIASILKVFECIFKSSVWVDDAIDTSSIATAWIALSNALRHASSKEITPSTESMQAVAHILGLLQRLWTTGPSSLNAVQDGCMDRFFDRLCFLSTTIIYSLGGNPFTDKLVLKTTDQTFQVANTPTHRHSGENSNLVSPIVHFLQLISNRHNVPTPNTSYLLLVSGSLEAACSGRASRGSRLELLRQCTELCSTEDDPRFGDAYFFQVAWKVTTRLAAESLRRFPIESARERDESVLRDYENVIRILATGLKFPSDFRVWNQLLDSFVHVVKSERGDLAILSTVIEPVAGSVMRIWEGAYLPSAALIRHALSVPYYQDILSVGQSDASARTPPSGDSQPLFPETLIKLVEKALRVSYDRFNSSEGGMADFIESVVSLLTSGILAFRYKALEWLQGSLALWLKDEVQQLNTDAGGSRIVAARDALPSAALDIIQSSPPYDTLCLQKFETIVSAGLGSSHTSVSRKFADMWNSTFGLQESLDCPASISQALEKLHIDLASQTPSLVQPGGPKAGDDRGVPTNGEITNLQNSFQSTPTGSDSLAAVRTKESPKAVSPKQQTEDKSRQRQERPSSRGGDRSPFSAGSERSRRSELFSMITNLRSSSPTTNTPRRQEFKTPPHLREMRNPGPETRIPPTPTLAAATAENEEVFLGSSPTPGTRGRTQVPDISFAARDNHVNEDLPSSPPELHSLSPIVRNRPGPSKVSETRASCAGGNGTDRTKAKSTRKTPTALIGTPVSNGKTSQRKTDDDENQDSTQASKRAFERRPRSAKGRFMKSPGSRRDPDASPTKTPGDPTRVQEAKVGPMSRSAASTSKSRIQRDESPSATHTDGVSDGNDSGNDDVEAQIASQLEQDMELAMDRDEPASGEQAEPSNTYPGTKKRKRGVDVDSASPTKERRRSRRVSNKDAAAEADVKTIHTRRSIITRPVSNPSQEPSPVEQGSKKRKGRPEETTHNPASLESVDQSQGIDDDVEKSVGSLEPTQKRRKSSRLSGHTDSFASENGPSQSKEPLNRSRNKGKNKAIEARSSPRHSEAVSTEEARRTSSSDRAEVQGLPGKNTTQTSWKDPEQSHGNLPGPNIDKGRRAAQGDVVMQHSETDPDHTATSEIAHCTIVQETQNESDPSDAVILRCLRGVLDDVKLASLSMDTLKEVDDLLFEIRVQAHDALRKQPD